MKELTAAQWTHLCILSVHLRDIRHPATQGIHRNIITIFILPIGSFISSTLHLGFAVRYNKYNIIYSDKGFKLLK
jgi:hypothetical protein